MNNQQKTYYGIQDNQGRCIGLDQASGGYPWIPDLPSQVQWWHDPKPRDQYLASFKKEEGYTPVELKMTVKPG